MDTDTFDKAVVARIPALVKARLPDASGKRIVEVESSTEAVDADGDVVLQQSLLNSAPTFIAAGHLDIDHFSEFGARLGIPDPASYIIGRPIDVTSKSGNRTFVTGEIAKSRDNTFDPKTRRYDEFWASLQQDPPVVWYASIYGFPTDFEECRTNPVACSAVGATRLVIKAIDWRSLAFTRTPKNTALTSPAKIVTAKAYMIELAKGMGLGFAPIYGESSASMANTPGLSMPNSMQDVWAHKACAKCDVHSIPSLLGYRYHFAKCAGYPDGAADIAAHAMMYRRQMNAALGPQRSTTPATVM